MTAVVVVGAGPVGLLVATLLGRGGHEVEVLERRDRPYGRPRAVHIDHEAARILQSVGVMDDLAAEAMDAYEWRNAAGATLLRLEPPPGPARSGWPASLMFAQPQLEALLESAAHATGRVHIQRSCPVIGLDDEGDAVTVRSDRGRARAAFVVGCDGAGSTVRDAVGIAASDLGYRHDWLVVDVVPAHPTVWRPLNIQVCDPARPTTAVSGGPGRRRFEFMRLPGETTEELGTEATAWRLLEPWGLTPANAVLERHATYTFRAVLADQWVSGRVLLAGDAAHQMPPFAGQGLCSGIRDAASLAWKLDLVLRDEAPAGLLATYETERAPQVRLEIDFSIDLGKIICVLDPAEAAARDAGMLPAAGPIDLPPGPPLGPGVTRPGDPTGGTLSAQPILADGRRLDDATGAGWRLLGGGGPLPPDLAAWWERIGGTSHAMAEDGDATLVRPDLYVFGAGDPVALVASLRSVLSSVPSQTRPPTERALMAMHPDTELAHDGSSQQPDPFQARTEAAYAEVELEYWPHVRWWLPEGVATDETIDKNVATIHDVGFGGVEIIAIPEGGVDHTIYGWGSDEWNEDSRRVITEATRRGLAFSLTSGAHWGTANISDTHTYGGRPYDLDNQAASQELDYASVVVRAGDTFCGPLPRVTLPDQAKHAKVVTFLGAIAAKVVRERQSLETTDHVQAQSQGVLELGTLVDITDRVTGDDDARTLEFAAPADGDYEVFAFYMHGTGQTADPSASINYTINYLDPYGAEALKEYWSRHVLTDAVKADLEKSGRGELYMDSLEISTYGQGGLLWGFTLRDEFMRRRGYDPLPYLPFFVRTPRRGGGSSNNSRLELMIAAGAVRNGGNDRVLTNYVAESPESQATIQQVTTDLYRTVSELYCENTLGPLRSWLHENHMSLRAEPSYGYTLEISTPARYLDGVEVESFAQRGELDLYRNMLGSANMYARPYSSETGAVSRHNYYYNMDDWTQLAYLQFVLGVVRTVLHGWSGIEGPEPSTYWPGHEGMYPWFSERFDNRQPAFCAYPAWTSMLARNQKFLRVGVPRRDIAILRTDYAFANYDEPQPGVEGTFRDNYSMHDQPYYWKDLSLQAAGYTYDYFSAQLLADTENTALGDNLLQPETVGYRTVIVYQEALELDGARGLLRVAESGVPVLFVDGVTETINHLTADITHAEAASRPASLGESADDLRQIVAGIKHLPNVVTVERQADVAGVLRDTFGIRPRAGFADPSPDLLSISRYDEAAGVLNTFVYSYKFHTAKDAPAAETTLMLEGEGTPYLLDDWTGEVTEAPGWSVSDGQTAVPISLAPGESLRISLDLRAGHDGTAGGPSGASQVAWRVELPVWDIAVEDWNEGEKVVITESKFGHETREVHFTTRKTPLVFPGSPLVPWKDLPATAGQLAALAGDRPDAYGNQIPGRTGGEESRAGVDTPSMDHVSGIGTYTTTFTVPDDAPPARRVFLEIGSTGGGLAAVQVNGQAAPAMNPRSPRTDITDLLIPGENRLVVEVASTLTNRMLQKGYETEGPCQDYGMTGEVAVVGYE